MLDSKPNEYPFYAILAGHFMLALLGTVVSVWFSMDAFGLKPSALVASVVALLVPIAACEPVRKRSTKVIGGTANRITLLRGCLVAWLAAFAMTNGSNHQAFWVACVAAIALAMDGLDGFIARKTNGETEYGAKFDMEFDAMLMLVLSWLVFAWNQAGLWVLFCGLARYLWAAASAQFIWLRKEVPGEFRRKTGCVIGVIGLICAAAPIPHSALWAAIATGALALSFGMDTVWLFNRRRESTQ